MLIAIQTIKELIPVIIKFWYVAPVATVIACVFFSLGFVAGAWWATRGEK